MALLIAAWAHVALFFVFVVLLVLDMLSAKVIDEEGKSPPENRDQVELSLVYEEEPAMAAEVEITPPVPEDSPEVPKETALPPPTGFVQTQEDQAMESKPDESDFIGENNTKATSDAGAESGDQKLPALAGEDDLKQDLKTFKSDFADGQESGPQDGTSVDGEGGNSDAAMSQPEVLDLESPSKPSEPPVPEEVPKEEMTVPDKDELAAIDQALKELDEALADDKPVSKKVEETLPERVASQASESGNKDGGFAPQTRKTKVKGVINASGDGSVNVENTPVGRYQAKILKLLERSWQMENIQNRSLIAPGNITLYFAVNRNGIVSNQQQVAMNGASDTQWGMVLRALGSLDIPKMSKDVIEDLDGDALELTVTFNY